MGYPFIAGEFSPRKIPLKWMIMSWGTPIYGNHHMIILVRFGLVPEMQPGDKKRSMGWLRCMAREWTGTFWPNSFDKHLWRRVSLCVFHISCPSSRVMFFGYYCNLATIDISFCDYTYYCVVGVISFMTILSNCAVFAVPDCGQGQSHLYQAAQHGWPRVAGSGGMEPSRATKPWHCFENVWKRVWIQVGEK